jgi:hypothetical protein
VVSLARQTFGPAVVLERQERFHLMDLKTPVARAPRIVHVDAGTAAAPDTTGTGPANRLTDATPYYGGSRIVNLRTVNGQQFIFQCTTAFTAVDLAHSAPGRWPRAEYQWMVPASSTA